MTGTPLKFDELTKLFPTIGERAFVCGQTGSGKTTFVCELLRRHPSSPLVIYDTKFEPKFTQLPKSSVAHSLREAEELVDDPAFDFIVFRPHGRLVADPEGLDKLLEHHFHNWAGTDLYIDEAYPFHKGGRAGPGLVTLYTQGRSRGITTILSSQRPAYLSRFCITEAQKFYAFRLIDERDKKTLAGVIPGFVDLPNPPEFGGWFFKPGDEAARSFLPVPLDGKADTGYIDISQPVPTRAREWVWL